MKLTRIFQSKIITSLQNAVRDLEEKLIIEKNNSSEALRKNTEFISDISHQLKTPLAGLKLYVEMELANNEGSHAEKELALINKMENLIYRLLRLEKIKSDSYKMEFEPLSLGAVANEVINEFKPIYPDKNFTVSGDSILRIDKSWMYEAIANVVKNAAQHTPENGYIRIEINRNEKSTCVFISDNGGGVSAEDLPALFCRFSKTSNAASDSAGIGLAITKAIVEKHHGTVTAENGKDGLKISFCLPHIDGYRSF